MNRYISSVRGRNWVLRLELRRNDLLRVQAPLAALVVIFGVMIFRPYSEVGYKPSRVFKRLHQGSRPPTGAVLAELGFEVLVLCAEEYQPAAENFPGLRHVIHAPYDDNMANGLKPEELVIAQSAARKVAMHLRKGRKVLVTCQAGANRSGLVSALAICRVSGMSGMQAASKIRESRPIALFNPHFVNHLLTVPRRERRV